MPQSALIPPIVLDANVLIDDVVQGISRGHSTALMRVLVAPGVMCCAAKHIVGEVMTYLPAQPERLGVDPDAAATLFEESSTPTQAASTTPESERLQLATSTTSTRQAWWFSLPQHCVSHEIAT